MGMLESHKMAKGKAKGNHHNSNRVSFFLDQKAPKRREAGDKKAARTRQVGDRQSP